MDSPLTLLCGLLSVALYLSPTTAYIEKILENDSVCSMSFTSNNINLIGREDESALVIRDSRYFQHWTGKHEFDCKFTVTSSLGLGIFAVIQRLSFRRNAQGQCIDYVQFRHSEKTISFGDFNLKFKSSDPWSDKICGNVNALEVDVDDNDELNNNDDDDKAVLNSFINHRGLVEVRIHLGNKSLEIGEELSFEMVFTAFQECKYDNGLWKSCGSRTCIYKEFFQDGKLNCPYKSCKDESGCHPVVAFNGNGERNTTVGTKLLVGTVAGLFTMFVAFIAFIWLFRHCGTVFCCMGHPNSHPHSSEMQPVPNLDTMANVIATAPPESFAASGTDLRSADKDLPPSYESLFPTK